MYRVRTIVAIRLRRSRSRRLARSWSTASSCVECSHEGVCRYPAVWEGAQIVEHCCHVLLRVPR